MTIFLVGTIEPSLKIADFGKLFLAKSLVADEADKLLLVEKSRFPVCNKGNPLF